MLQACLQEKLSTSTAPKGVKPGSTDHHLSGGDLVGGLP
jgi:hypothetical protein